MFDKCVVYLHYQLTIKLPNMNNLTPSDKAQLTKQIKLQAEYIDALLHECKTQHPQPNGTQYLHGEIITLRRVNEEINYYNELVKRRESTTVFSMNRISWLPKYEKPLHVTQVQYTDRKFTVELTYTEKMYLVDMCNEDIPTYGTDTITQKIVKSILAKLTTK